jgi:hypothetical protein
MISHNAKGSYRVSGWRASASATKPAMRVPSSAFPRRRVLWTTDVLERMVSGRIKATELERLLSWTWQAERLTAAVET